MEVEDGETRSRGAGALSAIRPGSKAKVKSSASKIASSTHRIAIHLGSQRSAMTDWTLGPIILLLTWT